MPPTADTPPLGPTVTRWVAEIDRYEKEAAKWHMQSKKILKRYKDERQGRDNPQRYNVLWSTTQTLLPALYARNPKPVVTRRYRDKDPVGRVAADVLERCCGYFADTDAFEEVMQQSVQDYLLPGRGTVWVRYVPHFKDAELRGNAEVSGEGAQLTDDAYAEDEIPQEIDYEEVVVDYVHWEDFGHVIGRTWQEVPAVWRKAYLERKELVERFGKAGKTIPLDHAEKDLSGQPKTGCTPKATVYEIWDKVSGKAVWVHKNVPEPLDERDDPLQLTGFFPCPRPLLANLANDSCIPTPDYKQWQDQANQLDELTARIATLTKAVKAAGVYDVNAQGVDRLLSEGVENKLIPVDQWAIFAEKGGLKGAIELLPMQEIAQTLLALYDARERVKADLDEITGISDIIRGNSDPRETAKAQQMKGQYASLRLSARQANVQRLARGLMRIIGEIVATHFGLETIQAISGRQLLTAAEKQQLQAAQAQQQALPPGAEDLLSEPTWEEVFSLLRDNPGRCFRISIETDSTIKADEEQEKADRIEFLNVLTGFMGQAIAAAQQTPALLPLMGQMLQFCIRSFAVGKDLEQSFSAWIDKSEKEAASPEQKPDPEQVKAQAQMQVEQMKAQIQLQMKQQELQLSAQAEAAKQQAQAAQIEQQNRIQAERESLKIQQEMELERLKAGLQLELEQYKIQQETERAITIERIKAETQLTIARMRGEQAVATASISAEARAAVPGPEGDI